MGGRARRGVVAAAMAVLAAVPVLTGCGATPPPAPAVTNRVVVASFNFGESELLAEIYAQALESAGIPVRRELDLGPRELVMPALRQGLVDLLPEYLGTALETLAPSSPFDRHNAAAVLDALRAALSRYRLAALAPSRAEDRNGYAVTAATAARLHLRTLSDLAAAAPRLVLGGPTECPQRPYCLAGLERVYGLRFDRFLAFDDEAQRMTALDEGLIDVAVTFTTAGELATGRLVLLRDDRHLQPVEQVVPVVSERTLARYGPRLVRELNAVSAELDSAALTFLNWRVGVRGGSPHDEAAAWLARQHLVHRR